MSIDNEDDMLNSPEMTPEEEAAAVEQYREKLKLLNDSPAPTDPGQIRLRKREKEELELRLKEYAERQQQSEPEESAE